jgi:hypothetical protein
MVAIWARNAENRNLILASLLRGDRSRAREDEDMEVGPSPWVTAELSLIQRMMNRVIFG